MSIIDTKKVAEDILKNHSLYTVEIIRLAEAYIKLLKGFGIYEDDRVFKSH